MSESDARCERCGATGPACAINVRDRDTPLEIIRRSLAGEERSIFTLHDLSSPPSTTSWPPLCAQCFDKLMETALSIGDTNCGQMFERLRRAEFN
jgi:hypothetical protein